MLPSLSPTQLRNLLTILKTPFWITVKENTLFKGHALKTQTTGAEVDLRTQQEPVVNVDLVRSH